MTTPDVREAIDGLTEVYEALERETRATTSSVRADRMSDLASHVLTARNLLAALRAPVSPTPDVPQDDDARIAAELIKRVDGIKVLSPAERRVIKAALRSSPPTGEGLSYDGQKAEQRARDAEAKQAEAEQWLKAEREAGNIAMRAAERAVAEATRAAYTDAARLVDRIVDLVPRNANFSSGAVRQIAEEIQALAAKAQPPQEEA